MPKAMREAAERAYAELLRRARERTVLTSCSALLEWDEETCMPRQGVLHRGRQRALLAGLEHAWLTEPSLGDLIAEIEASPLVAVPGSPEAVNVRGLARIHRRARAVERRLVEELAEVCTVAQHEWAHARATADFRRLRPWLERVVALKRLEARAISSGISSATGSVAEPYDALLEEYEPGASARQLEGLFSSIEQESRRLLGIVRGSDRRAPVEILHRAYPLNGQRTLAADVARAIGFDLAWGRIDESEHPFTSQIGPEDIRITTRFVVDDLSEGLFSTLHEVGHALYDRGLEPEHYGSPMGEAASLGVHESQARLWENLVGRSLGFWRHFFPIARRCLPEVLDDVSLSEVHAAVNHVAPSLSRIRADEVTYNLHILIRFELERALIAGDLEVEDLPAAFDEASVRHLGLRPADDGLGVLQDGHWAAGMFGYFPTYTLGNLIAAQLHEAAARALGDLDEAFGRGEYGPLLAWLREQVHRHGQRYGAAELVEHATGAPLATQPLIRLLERKVAAHYG